MIQLHSNDIVWYKLPNLTASELGIFHLTVFFAHRTVPRPREEIDVTKKRGRDGIEMDNLRWLKDCVTFCDDDDDDDDDGVSRIPLAISFLCINTDFSFTNYKSVFFFPLLLLCKHKRDKNFNQSPRFIRSSAKH